MRLKISSAKLVVILSREDELSEDNKSISLRI